MTELECPHCRKAFSVEVRAGISAGAPHGSAPVPDMRRKHKHDVLLVGLMLMVPAAFATREGYLSWPIFAIACFAVFNMALIDWSAFWLSWKNRCPRPHPSDAIARLEGRDPPPRQRSKW
jgi:hypothetical protein